ncbi:MAG: TIGR02996 domain-containing protein [Kofleriaceae bacterium]
MTIEADLLAAIAAEVDAVEPRLVYADWLQAQGDPRGELAIVTHRLSLQPRDPGLLARWSELRSPLEASMNAGLQHQALGRWRIGFVDELTIHRRLLVHLRTVPDWFEHPALRFVRTLHHAPTDPASWHAVRAWRHRGSVRTLRHGTVQKQLDAAALATIAELLPRLTSLELGSMAMPDLRLLAALPVRALRIDLARADHAGLDRLFAVPWQLERLVIRGPVELEMIGDLLAGQVLASVRHLELMQVPTLDVIARLVASGRLASLETLSLPFLDYTYDHARLGELRDPLAHVRLEVPLNGSYIDGRRLLDFAELLGHRLDRHADALALFEAGDVSSFSDHHHRAYARALLHAGDRANLAGAFDRMHRRGVRDDRTIARVAGALLAVEHDPDVAIVYARSLAMAGRTAEALAAVARLPPSDSERLIRALLDPPGIPALRTDASTAFYRALAGLLAGDLQLPEHCITPDAIVAELGVLARDRLDCAELAVIAAVLAGRRDVAIARMHALAAELPDGERPYHHDLRVAVHGVQTDRTRKDFALQVIEATRANNAAERLVALAGP